MVFAYRWSRSFSNSERSFFGAGAIRPRSRNAASRCSLHVKSFAMGVGFLTRVVEVLLTVVVLICPVAGDLSLLASFLKRPFASF